MENQTKWMKIAIELATENAKTGHGGPFGAIIVKDGEIIGRGVNEVTYSCDPTAHAEVQAIRDACKHLNSFQLDGCEIYTSCEPCPMCLGAIYWARPRAIYFACTKEEAASINFDDQFIYEEIELPYEKRGIVTIHMTPEGYDAPFRTWESSSTKVDY
jgi:guanine deaminase